MLDKIVDAIHRLERSYPDVAKVVVLHFFGGMNHAEVANTLEISEPTVRRRWSFARAWLHKVISEDQGLSAARVLLCACLREPLAAGLRLLGIAPLEEM